MKVIAILCIAMTLFTSTIFGADKILKLERETITPRQVNQSKNPDLLEFAADNYASLISIENAPDSPRFKVRIERPLFRDVPSEKDKKFHIEIDLSKDLLAKMAVDFDNKFPCFVITSQGFLPGEEVNLHVECDGHKSAVLKFYPHPIEMKSDTDEANITVRLTSMVFSNTMYCFYFKDFLPDEEVKYAAESCGEFLTNELKVKQDLVFGLTCGVEGYDGGIETFKLYRTNGEVLEVAFPWGHHLEEYLGGDKKAIVTQTTMIKPRVLK
jgi:hypothetical protein